MFKRENYAKAVSLLKDAAIRLPSEPTVASTEKSAAQTALAALK